jgi:hypothetical protein
MGNGELSIEIISLQFLPEQDRNIMNVNQPETNSASVLLQFALGPSAQWVLSDLSLNLNKSRTQPEQFLNKP